MNHRMHAATRAARSSRLFALSALAVCVAITLLATLPKASAATAPNDPKFSQQWAPVQVKADQAWDVARGSAEVRVAVVDTGITASLLDLQGQLAPGYNAINPGASTNDDFTGYGIGTLIAGIVGAKTNNGTDIAGTSWNITMMPVKVCDNYCNYNPLDVAEGITWAADNGADIIHVSLGLPATTAEIDAAVAYAQGRGALVVSAAGNVAARVGYPAALPGVIAVGSTNSAGAVSSFSGRGAAIDIVAPGESILTLVRAGCCVTRTGTELGAAHVSGALALMLAAGVPASQAPGYLFESAQDLGAPGWDSDSGHGLLDVCGALAAAGVACGSSAPTATSTSTAVPPTQTSTSVPATSTPTRTSTAVPATSTPTRTSTAVPPTSTPTRTSTVLPPTSTPTPTSTVLPPTSTPTRTSTPVPPTSTATPAPGATTITGKLQGKTKVTTDTVFLSAGQSFSASLTWSGSAQVQLTLLNASGQVVATGSGGSGFRNLDYTATASGTYTLRLQLISGKSASYTLVTTY